MNWTQIIFNAFGGLGLFLMGMKIMSESIQKIAGDGLRKILSFLTSNRFMGIFIGFFITALIQSSSATTVMVVGFVNASLMTLQQAIGVIFGANIGTTVTGWLVTLAVVEYSLPIIGFGVMLRFFSKSEKWRYFGEIMFGFGILFLGMETMKNGFAPLKESPEFIALFTKVDGSGYFTIVLGVLIGTATTLIVQSSSATIGITIALASQGLLNYQGAVSLILGDNVGTTITAILASVGGNYQAKRAAVAHTLFNVFGVMVILIIFYPFIKMVDSVVPGVAEMSIKTAEQAAKFGLQIGDKPYIGQHIAMAHSMFNIMNVILFTGFIPLLAKLCEKIIPVPKQPQEYRMIEFSHIDSTLINTPTLAIAETEKKLILMAERVAKSALMVQDIMASESPQKKVCDEILVSEKVIDEYQKHITEFLVSLSSTSLSENDANHVGNYMSMSHNLEKYGDHLEHIALIFDRMDRDSLVLSMEARQTAIVIFKEISGFFNGAFNAFTEDVDAQTFMDGAQVHNRRVKKLIKTAKMEHFDRLSQEKCTSPSAIHFMDLLNYLDGMRAQAYNIAEISTGTKYQH